MKWLLEFWLKGKKDVVLDDLEWVLESNRVTSFFFEF